MKLDGKPKPKVGWYKQGIEVVSSKDFQIEEYEDGISVLTIPEVFPDDTGEITCVAENEFGVASTSTELVVEGMFGNTFKLSISVSSHLLFTEDNTVNCKVILMICWSSL